MQNYLYYKILKQERQKHFLTQEKLAEAIGADARLVRAWESGDRFPSYKYCRALCNLYKKSPEDLGLAKRPEYTIRAAPTKKTDYRRITGAASSTHVKIIQQREHTVRKIYEWLIQPDITAITITGLAGVGKSTLAALISHYAEEQYYAGHGPFNALPLWLRVDPAVSMADLVGTIAQSLGDALPDLSHLSPQSQALALFHILNTTDKPRLIVLDQFENVLDWQTGLTLIDRFGIAEWLDVINSQPCRCRLLLTSRLWPQGTRHSPASYMQEYHDKGLQSEEGMELLEKQGVKATKEELRSAVASCKGHAFALTLLAAFLRRHNLCLTTLLKNSAYAQLWMGNIARNLLDSMYKQQLNQVQRKLLAAFSIYREPVPLDAIVALLDLFNISQVQVALEHDVLLTQHLLQTCEEGRYQLHAIVANYIQAQFAEDHAQIDHQTSGVAHSKAAQYYLQQAAINSPVPALRRHISDIHDLIEAIWHLCQAQQWQAAYDVMRQEQIFTDLICWGGSGTLLELLQHLLPLDKWHPAPLQAAYIYNALSNVYNNLWQNERALDYCEQALQVYREVGDRVGEGAALSNLCEIYSGLGQNERALHYAQQSLYMYRELADRSGQGRAFNNLGWIHFVLGEKQQALLYYQQALSFHRSTGNRRGEGIALNGSALIYYMLGQHDQALERYQQALRIRRDVADRAGEGITLNGLGLLYARLAQHDQALDCYNQALIIHGEVGERGGEGRILNNIGDIHVELGQYEQALDYCRRALSVSIEAGDREGEGWILTSLGKIYQVQGQKQEALDYYQQALRVNREVGAREGEGQLLQYIGALYLERKDYDIALACLQYAKHTLEEIPGLDRDNVQELIDTLRRQVGEEQFSAALDQIKLHTFSLDAQTLRLRVQEEHISQDLSEPIASAKV